MRQRILCAGLLVCGLLFLSARSQASDGAPGEPAQRAWLAGVPGHKPASIASAPRPNMTRSWLALGVAALLGGLAFYLRSAKPKARRAVVANLRVLSSTKLGARASLVIVDVSGQKLMLGVTDASVNKLGWLDAPEAEDDAEDHLPEPRALVRPRLVTPSAQVAIQEKADGPGAGRSFRTLLKSALGGRDKAADSAAVAIAAQTRDTFTRSGARPLARATSSSRGVMVDVEGQARGLLARLGGEPRA
ncbi:MAG TPA: flagellar biosynthetic protein FliO [Polyangiaceae bacterium]